MRWSRGGGDLGPVAALARAGNVHFLPVLGDGPAGDNEVLLLELFDQLVVREWVGFVFLINDLLQADADDVPGDVLAFIALGATDEEPLEREDAARRLNVLVIDGSAHGRHVHADFVRDLLHLEGLDELGAILKEFGLMIDDGLSDFGERAAALLDRFNKPLSRVDFALDVLALFGRGGPALQALAIVPADVQRGRAAVIDGDLVVAFFSALDADVGRDGGDEVLAELCARLGIELAQLVPGFANALDGIASDLLYQRKAIVAEVLEVAGDKCLQLLVILHIWVQLGQQAFTEIAGGNAGWIERLNERKSFLGFLKLFGRGVGREQVAKAGAEIASVFWIERADDSLAEGELGWIHIQFAKLMHQVVLQRFGPLRNVSNDIV